MENIKVELRKDGCDGYLVIINENDRTHTWGFNNISDVRMWQKVLTEVIEKWRSLEKQNE